MDKEKKLEKKPREINKVKQAPEPTKTSNAKKVLKSVAAAGGFAGIVAGTIGALIVAHALRMPGATHRGIHMAFEKYCKDLNEWANR